MKKIDTVIFDLDGTLLNTLEDLTDSVNYALKKYHLPQRTLEEIRSFVGNGIEVLLTKAVPDGKANPLFSDVFLAFKTYYGEHCNDKTCLYDGMKELILWLKQKGYKLAIVSNKADFAVKELQKIYFSSLIDVAIGEQQENGIGRKPEPDMVYEAIKQLKSTKEQSIYIGDSEVDILTAANAEIPCINALWGFRSASFLKEHGAKHMANNPEEVIAMLNAMEE